MKIALFEIDAVVLLTSGEVSPAELQSRLRDLGYYDGPDESQPWQETLQALRRFQNNSGLPVTGCPDADTMTRLRESYCY